MWLTKIIYFVINKNLNLSFSTWLTHLILRFLYIFGCSGPWCAIALGWKNLIFLSKFLWHPWGILKSKWDSNSSKTQITKLWEEFRLQKADSFAFCSLKTRICHSRNNSKQELIKIYYLIARWEQFENVRVLIIPFNHGIKIKTQEICNQFRFYSVAFEKMKKTLQQWEV